MRKIAIRWLINAVALGIAAEIVPGIESAGDIRTIIVVAAIFGLVNALIRPVVKSLTCPLIILTLGLFTLVINAAMLGLTGWLANQFGCGYHVGGVVAALWGALVVTVVSLVLSLVLREDD